MLEGGDSQTENRVEGREGVNWGGTGSGCVGTLGSGTVTGGGSAKGCEGELGEAGLAGG